MGYSSQLKHKAVSCAQPIQFSGKPHGGDCQNKNHSQSGCKHLLVTKCTQRQNEVYETSTTAHIHPDFLRADKLEKKDIGKVDNI